MIKVFGIDDTLFSSNGDVVIQPYKAQVHKIDNGDFYLDLECPLDYLDYISPNNIVVAPTPQGDQAFRIKNVSTTRRKITAKCLHLFYDSENYLISDSYAVQMNCKDALAHFNAATDNTSPFSTYSDITKINTFRCVRKSLAECIATVIERWGGHLKRDNWDISILSSPGTDNGITIEYKKNLEELTATYNWDDVVTKLMPVGKDGILLDQRYVYSTVQYDIPYTKAISFEQDIDQESYSSEAAYIAAVKADLLAQATEYVNTYCYPSVNYTLKGNPEKVTDIGDKIEVKDERIGVNVLTEVIAYEYDAIMGRYVNLEFGNFTNTLSDLMNNISKETSNTVNMAVSEITTETDRIYELLENGYVVFRGSDILVLDSLPASDALYVMKINQNGVSISTQGVNGLFTSIYELGNKRLKVNSDNSINIYDTGNNLIGTINTGGISVTADDYLKINGHTLDDLLQDKQDALTAGNGIDITNDTISLAKYDTGDTIINATLSGVCVADNGTVSFEIDIDKPCNGLNIYNLTVTVYDSALTATTIVTDGTAATGITVTATAITTTKYQIDITPMSISDGAYIIKYDIQLKAL